MDTKTFLQYTGTKTIFAIPMGAGEAKRHGANITDDVVRNNLGNDGYLVEYTDGYRSWCPAKEFHASYRLSETHLDRLHIELAELKERIINVTDALYSELQLHSDQRPLLDAQLRAMRSYADVLLERIKHEVQINKERAICVSSEPKVADHNIAKGGEQ